jgi:DNA helicase II / ATP-dependent DNA helicase PcrA
MTREEATQEGQREALRIKQRCATHGLITYSDAMYYALEIVRGSSEVAASVARRFDELIVDEAQDTSDVQLAALETIQKAGLRSLVLVGDLDQSIYGFQGAAPELCRAVVERIHLDELPLTQNFRSSQAICNVTCRFRGDRDPDLAVGPDRDCPIEPEILLYPAGDPVAAREQFRKRLSHHGVDVAQGVVVTRGHNLAERINGMRRSEIKSPVVAIGTLAAGRAIPATLTRNAVAAAEDVLAELAWDRSTSSLSEDERWLLRQAIMDLTERLPLLTGTLKDWVTSAREAVGQSLAMLTDAPAHRPGDRIRADQAYAAIDAATCFVPAAIELEAQTVHSVKGESHRCVLLVADPTTRREEPQSSLWAKPLLGEVEASNQEELRIAYVALTRAEVFCAIALPDNASQTLLQAFLDAGFAKPR